MNLIDSHCHLYLPDFEIDLDAVVERAVRNGVEKIFLPAIDSETHQKLIELSERKFEIDNPKLEIFPMMGLHPCSVKENFEDELKIVEQHLSNERKFYAIGEIGLDYHWDLTFKGKQVIAFERQIEMAIERNLPIVIHSRKSTGDCIKSVKKFEGSVNGIFHCFSGTLKEAREITGLGFYLGIGGVVTYKNSGLKEILRQTGLNQVVLETDAPYLTPIPHRGKRNEPGYVNLVCNSVADALRLSPDEVASITSLNVRKMFQL